jgi:activator of HSP90 ATPase
MPTDNFLHKTKNVTQWMKNEIETHLQEKDYEIGLLTVDCEIMARMNKISILNNVNLKISNKKGENFSLQNYNSSNVEYDDLKLKWLVDFIKEREKQAVLKFGGIDESANKMNAEATGQNVIVEISGKKEFEKLTFSTLFNSKADELMSFFTEKKYILHWAGPATTFESIDNENSNFILISFESIVLKNIVKTKNIIEMEYKWKDWSNFSKVRLEFLKIGEHVRIDLKQEKIPVGLKDNVFNHWNTRIFSIISLIFRAPIIPL